MIPTEGYDTHNKINYDITHLKITKKTVKPVQPTLHLILIRFLCILFMR